MDLEKEIKDIKERNRSVEANKAWETSFSRKVFIITTTYILMVIFLTYLENDKPFINALVPTLGYFLSTISAPIVKKYWINKYYK